jgi:hypothetical protein
MPPPSELNNLHQNLGPQLHTR